MIDFLNPIGTNLKELGTSFMIQNIHHHSMIKNVPLNSNSYFQ